MSRTPRDPDLLKIGEVARLLDRSVDTVRNWDANGKLTSVRTVGNQRRFHRAEVDALLAAETSAA